MGSGALWRENLVGGKQKSNVYAGLAKYGYGFFIAEQPLGKSSEKTKLIQHSGGINGFNSLLTRLVDKQQTIILLDNVSLGRYHDAISTGIAGILNSQPYDTPKKSIGEALYKIANENGGVAAVAEYRKLKSTRAAMYDFSESELNALGYRLLRSNHQKDAIEIFKLNVEMFPQSANSYDSLGEAYLADNQKELALANYRKTIALAPENANAKQIVNRLEGREMKVNADVFDAYVGEYELAPNFVLTITKEGEKLFGQANGPGQTKLQLEPVSETQFVVPSIKAEVVFEKDSAGKVISLNLTQNGKITKGRKIK
jgi:tetratricopeptide (TPR) repeat protein